MKPLLSMLTAACVAAALAAPAAVARHAPDDSARPRQVVPSTFTMLDERDARLGPKYVTVPAVYGSSAPAAGERPGRGFPYWILVLGGVALGLVGLHRIAVRGRPSGSVTAEE
jgi:hypothetical protein